MTGYYLLYQSAFSLFELIKTVSHLNYYVPGCYAAIELSLRRTLQHPVLC